MQLAIVLAAITAVFAFPLLRAGGPAPPWQRPPPLRLRLGGISPRAPPLFA